MTNYLISVLLFCQFASATSSSICVDNEYFGTQDSQQVLRIRVEEIKNAYGKLSNSPYTNKYQKEYFDVFPNSFRLLNNLFGYSNGYPFGAESFDSPLQKEALPYIRAFFKLDGIDTIEYFNRIIDISLNGRWYVDAITYFQSGSQEKILNELDVFIEILSKRKDAEIKSFWYFYFDGPIPDKTIPPKLLRVKDINSKMYVLMEQSLRQVQDAWKDRD